MARSQTVFSLSLVAAIALVALVAGVVGGRATGQAARPAAVAAAAGRRPARKSTSSSGPATPRTGRRCWPAPKRPPPTSASMSATFGPTSETDIAGQVQLVENSVSRGVDAIVIAPSSSEALNSSIDAAREAGIKVITADTRVTAAIEGHIGTNNKLAGTQAGQRMCELLTAAGKTTGKVLVEAPVAGIEANQDRDAGFRAGLAEKCPNIDSSLQSYNNNDIGTAASQVNDAIVREPRPGRRLRRQQQLRCRSGHRDQGQQRRRHHPGRRLRLRPRGERRPGRRHDRRSGRAEPVLPRLPGRGRGRDGHPGPDPAGHPRPRCGGRRPRTTWTTRRSSRCSSRRRRRPADDHPPSRKDRPSSS